MGGRQQTREPATGAKVAVALAVVGALVVGALAAVATGAVKLTWSPRTPSSVVTRSPTLPPATAAPTPTRAPARPVLRALDGKARTPTNAGLAEALGPLLASPALGAHASVAVRDVTTGKVVYGKDQTGSYIPASTTKILTSAAVLATLGPAHRFDTKVVAGSQPDQIVLVGGGDPLLATARARTRSDPAVARDYPTPATVDDLAAQTARRLRASGTTKVSLRFDDTLFSQPENPAWESQYVPSGVVARISSLWVDEAKLSWPARVPRASDPAQTAAKAFATALTARGVTVVGSPARGKAPAKSTELARVSSPPLEEIVEHTLLISDNDAAEVLARHVAIAEGKPATFAGATSAIKEVLARIGVTEADQIELHDGSGLSRQGRLSADVLTETLALAARPEFPELRAVLTGLPVAGFSGSLDQRFYGAAATGIGQVRAKTGTLSGIGSLAGVATTKDGTLLAFAVISDQARMSDPRPALDQIAATLAGCGCR
ncbi:D-alanyl-D-alanine carboxypeptidase/D-alanyl-D-alanine-endopeptidase [Actinopolymorpha alba]|uniref:D-alanyl-D-alanine carboxypeptidase/D-alanyl-D-alanine endopeptidase n=1 Tax=Actinopolymorpha alba TaxID=533267 RepID=UPI00037936AD|nr:D-alanyl-D-alanine carboxypeptidase/D-alanyl-D-alanine-endopeptidase [Actinopolymorpha alba]